MWKVYTIPNIVDKTIDQIDRLYNIKIHTDHLPTCGGTAESRIYIHAV